MEFFDWLMWFAFIPAGGAVIVGALLFFWLRRVLLTRLRVWTITLALVLLFVIVEIILILRFAYLLPD